MFCYAQLNEEGICIGTSQLSGEVEAVDMIRIDSCDTAYLGKRYQGGEWRDSPVPEGTPSTVEPQPAAGLAAVMDAVDIMLMAQADIYEKLLKIEEGKANG